MKECACAGEHNPAEFVATNGNGTLNCSAACSATGLPAASSAS